MKKLLPLVLLLLLAGLDSCNRTPKPLDPTSPAAAKAQLTVLRDSVDARWKQMMASDDAKVQATSRLLQQLEQQPGLSRAQLQPLARANDRLPRRRYTQQSMAASPTIDAYDAAQDSVLHLVFGLAQPATGQPSAPVQQLTNDIQAADSEVVGFRLRYDRAAKQFNNYLKLHQVELNSLGGKYSQLQPLPLFELQQ
ncbi:hypothetical protein SAMN02745146_1880 [Hymenobacter daecheongensis DSM 21074]|uniref:LemA protein n=1 Tax=Hymenobacter daecheongensis DSM 21074 TaxID=1121955 RepID=A0A1M6EZI4_9BACT|nr:hypothetical protein [Hymenobacter daecheongensis]SHI90852.1 hypothetical protein SAMN02745146_1880 [Hymenobacter daecheongensis DSM 21074]